MEDEKRDLTGGKSFFGWVYQDPKTGIVQTLVTLAGIVAIIAPFDLDNGIGACIALKTIGVLFAVGVPFSTYRAYKNRQNGKG